MGKLSLTLVVSRKNATLTVVVRIPHLQTAKIIIGIMLLALPSALAMELCRHDQLAGQAAIAQITFSNLWSNPGVQWNLG